MAVKAIVKQENKTENTLAKSTKKSNAGKDARAKVENKNSQDQDNQASANVGSEDKKLGVIAQRPVDINKTDHLRRIVQKTADFLGINPKITKTSFRAEDLKSILEDIKLSKQEAYLTLAAFLKYMVKKSEQYNHKIPQEQIDRINEEALAFDPILSLIMTYIHIALDKDIKDSMNTKEIYKTCKGNKDAKNRDIAIKNIRFQCMLYQLGQDEAAKIEQIKQHINKKNWKAIDDLVPSAGIPIAVDDMLAKFSPYFADYYYHAAKLNSEGGYILFETESMGMKYHILSKIVKIDTIKYPSPFAENDAMHASYATIKTSEIIQQCIKEIIVDIIGTNPESLMSAQAEQKLSASA